MATTPKQPKKNTGEPLWSSTDHDSLYPTPMNLRLARMPPRLRPSSEKIEKEDSPGYLMSLEDLYWIKESLHNLTKGKEDKSTLGAAMRLVEEKFNMVEKNLEEASHCQRTAEFFDLKNAVDSWRVFFRNTVAVGSVGAVLVIGGWLWQYYTLIDQVKRTSENIAQVTQSVAGFQTDYFRYKQDHFAESVNNLAANDARFIRLEYKLLSAMSKLSQGKKIDEPKAPVLPGNIKKGDLNDE